MSLSGEYPSPIREVERLSEHTLYPAERTDISLSITAPAQPGDYLLDIDLVQEGVAWFGSQGNAPIRIPVRVR